MRVKRKITGILMITIALSLFLIGCNKSKEEVILERPEQIANFLNKDMIGVEKIGNGNITPDQITLYGTADVGRFQYQCFYYDGEKEEESGYSYAVFRKGATGNYKAEFVQQPRKLIPLAENIMGAYYNDHFVVVSTNDKLARIEITGEIMEEVKVDTTPFIHALDIFEKQNTAKKIEAHFYDKEGNEL